MSRPVWTGTISFGLVSVPVKAFTATRDHAVHFHQLDRSSIDGVPNKVAAAKGKTLDLATQIIDSLASDWDPDQYRDTYTDDVKKAIKAKGKGKPIASEEPAEDGAEVLDLMAALRQSVEATKSSRSSGRSTTKRAGAKKAAQKHTAKAPAKKASTKRAAPKKAAARKSA